jgi:hypothetical protein
VFYDGGIFQPSQESWTSDQMAANMVGVVVMRFWSVVQLQGLDLLGRSSSYGGQSRVWDQDLQTM